LSTDEIWSTLPSHSLLPMGFAAKESLRVKSYAWKMLLCPSCGQQNPDGARFCNQCGAALDAVAHTPHEERKAVKALFADNLGAARSAPFRSIP
jgi:hypothetical protein